MNRQTPLQDQISEFIGHAKGYFAAANHETRKLSLIAKNGPHNDRLSAEAVEYAEKRFEARNKLLAVGPDLARQLEELGEDSRALLTFLHYIDGGGGVAPAGSVWVDLKVDLQRIGLKVGAGVGEIIDELVTLNQVAPLTGVHKRTLERYLKDGTIPDPDIPGGGGKAHKWYWGNLRPALTKVCTKQLPQKFPGSRMIPSDTTI